MNIVEIRQQIQEYVEQLSQEKLLVAADFLAYLAEQESNDATEENNYLFLKRRGLI